MTAVSAAASLRVRAITAGTTIRDLSRLDAIEGAIDVLRRARKRFNDAGYEVQTLRIALGPVIARLDAHQRDAALQRLQDIDALVADHGVIVSIGALLTHDVEDASLPAWTGELVRRTKHLSASVAVASIDHSVHQHAASTAARIMIELSKVMASGVANFRFAAAANIPA